MMSVNNWSRPSTASVRNRMARPLCISTLDLAYFRHGGVVTKAIVFARIAREEGFEPFFLTPSVDLHRTVRRTIRFHKTPILREIQFSRYTCHQLGVLFPELEYNAHRFPHAGLKRFLGEPIPCFAVSGNNHAARPFLDLGMDFSIWPGATYWEDCRHRIANAPWSLRKVLDLATKPVCENLERAIFQKAGRIAVDTRYTRDCALHIDPSWDGKTTVIPVPVDTDVYQPVPQPAHNSLVFIGRLSDPRKNLKLLLDAFALCGESLPRIELHLIGASDSTEQELLKNHPLASRIRWLHGISEEEKVRHIQNALALIIPSFQEGFGITGAEALACGTPVISTRCGGTEDHVIPGENGFLLQSFDPSEMSDAIRHLAKDPALQQRLSGQAREYALKHLSIRAVRPLLQNLIHA